MIASGWQPDRARGIFETLLVLDGEPIQLDAHLHRLAQSLDAVYSMELPPQAEEELRRAAEGIPLGRLRLTAALTEGGLGLDLLAGGVEPEAVFPAQGMKLHTLPVSSGLGAHKWVDRPGIDRPAPGQSGALIVDEGEALEAGWANVFAVRGGTLFTPPLDGRLLPGTTRGALLQIADEKGIGVRQGPLRPADLLAADEVFLSGSIRGVEAALELDGRPLAGCGPLSRRLAAALARRWGLPDGSDGLPEPAAAPQPGPLSR